MSVHGWMSKLWSLFGYPKYYVPYYNRDPKRDHNLDNRPDTFGVQNGRPSKNLGHTKPLIGSIPCMGGGAMATMMTCQYHRRIDAY